MAQGRHRGTAARTVADLVERWYQWRQGVKEISPTTLLGYRLQIDRRIIPALGHLPVRLRDVLVEQGGRGDHQHAAGFGAISASG